MRPPEVGRGRLTSGLSIELGLPTQSQHPKPVYDLVADAHTIITAREAVSLLASRVVGA